jgi:hypothetical protein
MEDKDGGRDWSVMYLKAKKSPEAEQRKKEPPGGTSETAWPCRHIDFRFSLQN